MALLPPVRFTVSLLPDTITVSLESVRATLVLLAETVPLLIVGSTVTAKADEATPVLPAVSVSVAVKLWVAFDRVPVVKLQAPLPFTVAVPSLVVPSNTATVLLASAAPVSVSVLTLVMWSPTTPLSGENDVMAGALGGTVSTVTAKADEATPVLPAASVAVAVRLWAPLLSAAVVKLHAPLPFATAVP